MTKRVAFVIHDLKRGELWPLQLCDGNGRQVGILSDNAFARWHPYVVYARTLPRLIKMSSEYDAIVFWDANEGVLFSAVAKALRLMRPRIFLFDLTVYRGGLFRALVDILIAYASDRIDAVTVMAKAQVSLYGSYFPKLRGIYCNPITYGVTVPQVIERCINN